MPYTGGKCRKLWKLTAVTYKMDTEKIERLTNQRIIEWNTVQDYIQTKEQHP